MGLDVVAKIKANMTTAQLENQRAVITTTSPYSQKLIELIARDGSISVNRFLKTFEKEEAALAKNCID